MLHVNSDYLKVAELQTMITFFFMPIFCDIYSNTFKIRKGDLQFLILKHQQTLRKQNHNNINHMHTKMVKIKDSDNIHC